MAEHPKLLPLLLLLQASLIVNSNSELPSTEEQLDEELLLAL